MASRELEGPLLALKTYRADPSNWLQQGLGETSRVLSITSKGCEPYLPKRVAHHSWEYLDEEFLGIEYPDASFDAVYITDVLERLPFHERRDLIREAARVCTNGGRIVAYSPACDDGEEAYELIKGYVVDVGEFLNRRLSNKDIVRVKPHEAAFFQTRQVVPGRERLLKALQDLGIDATLEHMWGVKEDVRFAIKRFHVGMIWHITRV